MEPLGLLGLGLSRNHAGLKKEDYMHQELSGNVDSSQQMVEHADLNHLKLFYTGCWAGGLDLNCNYPKATFSVPFGWPLPYRHRFMQRFFVSPFPGVAEAQRPTGAGSEGPLISLVNINNIQQYHRAVGLVERTGSNILSSIFHLSLGNTQLISHGKK